MKIRLVYHVGPEIKYEEVTHSGLLALQVVHGNTVIEIRDDAGANRLCISAAGQYDNTRLIMRPHAANLISVETEA